MSITNNISYLAQCQICVAGNSIVKEDSYFGQTSRTEENRDYVGQNRAAATSQTRRNRAAKDHVFELEVEELS